MIEIFERTRVDHTNGDCIKIRQYTPEYVGTATIPVGLPKVKEESYPIRTFRYRIHPHTDVVRHLVIIDPNKEIPLVSTIDNVNLMEIETHNKIIESVKRLANDLRNYSFFRRLFKWKEVMDIFQNELEDVLIK